MRVDAADEHAILLDDAESGRRLARAGDDALPSRRSRREEQPPRLGRDAGAAGERIESYSLAEQQIAGATVDACDGDLALASVDVIALL